MKKKKLKKDQFFLTEKESNIASTVVRILDEIESVLVITLRDLQFPFNAIKNSWYRFDNVNLRKKEVTNIRLRCAKFMEKSCLFVFHFWKTTADSETSRDNVSLHLKSWGSRRSNDLHEQPSETLCVQLTRDTPSSTAAVRKQVSEKYFTNDSERRKET